MTFSVQPGGNKGKENMRREEGVGNFGHRVQNNGAVSEGSCLFPQPLLLVRTKLRSPLPACHMPSPFRASLFHSWTQPVIALIVSRVLPTIPVHHPLSCHGDLSKASVPHFLAQHPSVAFHYPQDRKSWLAPPASFHFFPLLSLLIYCAPPLLDCP